ncbi:MAG TPA: peptidylprolyl isomerase [Candidatus Thermoplasmatota archaeon]|nr:peptidylprolyl isomerase [Candidatus Thermoplasmatota archaeon]
MRTMKLKNLFAITMILSSICVIAAFSGAASDRSINEGTENFRSSEYLQKKTFLFGSIKNLNAEGDYSTVEPVNLRIIFFKPFQLFHDTTGGPITFLNQDRGIILADSFVLGRFTVVLPINTNSIAVMNTTLGTIIIELYEDKMPLTSENFITLANDGFYNGLVFHRVIEDFVIQGGGYYPNGTEKISPYGPIDLEINPQVHHLDGTIGMARTNDPNSATSQFFIDDGAQRYLEPNGSDPNGYAAFGRVLKGIEVVRAIAQVETMTKYGVMEDWPVDDIVIESVTILHR